MTNESKISRDEKAGIRTSAACGGLAAGSVALNVIYNTGLGIAAGTAATVIPFVCAASAAYMGGLCGVGLFKVVRAFTADDSDDRQPLTPSYVAISNENAATINNSDSDQHTMQYPAPPRL